MVSGSSWVKRQLSVAFLKQKLLEKRLIFDINVGNGLIRLSVKKVDEFPRKIWEGFIFGCLKWLSGLLAELLEFDLHFRVLNFSAEIVVYLLLYHDCLFHRIQFLLYLLDLIIQFNLYLPLCQDAVLDLCDLLSSWHFSCHARLCDGIYVTEIIVLFAILWLRWGQNYFSQIGG